MFRLVADNHYKVKWKNRYPCLFDKTLSTSFDRHYTIHPAWAARKIREFNIQKHVDISSSIPFVAVLSAFCEVDFYDFRPAELNLPGLKSLEGNLLKLPFDNNSVKSISSMHVIEHIGLGRYGDTMDPNGDLKAVAELKRVVSKDGLLLLVVPFSYESSLYFNAHRTYSFSHVTSWFNEDDWSLIDFSLIPEEHSDGDLVKSPSEELMKKQKYGCACYAWRKNKNDTDPFSNFRS